MSGKAVLRRRALLTGAATLPAIGGARGEPTPVTFAMISPLSGPWAREGELQRGGAEMAIDDINAAGGIKALGGAKVRLVQYDAGDSAEKAKNAAQRMIAQEANVSGGFGAWLSTFTLAVTEVTERAEIPWFTQVVFRSDHRAGFSLCVPVLANGGGSGREGTADNSGPGSAHHRQAAEAGCDHR